MPAAKAEASVEFVLILLAREGQVWVYEASDSMSPLIRPGDQLCLRPLEPTGARTGMIIAFRRHGELIVHRLLGATPAGLVTKGDALVDVDAPLSTGEIVARVVAIRSPAGRLIDLDRAPWPQIGRVLAAVARIPAPTPLTRKALRIPCHLAAVLGR
jgi:hypothetical protein